ncbi:MAG TPA: T9SS type A sorting domain-containing protein [Cyclobacteriaceae bacterium]|nr:T9SS type A sorting domain-containing protein [Cyclobacteriaceae bacterium]
MKTNIIIVVVLTTISICASAQNYTSNGDGNWTTASKWNNTSGWGTTTPPVDGSHGSGTITMNNVMTITGNYKTGSATLNINASKSLTVTGNMTLGGGSDVNVSGTLTVNGDLTLNSTLNILPGGKVVVYGNVIVNSSNYLIVGTSAASPPYADLVIKNDLRQNNSGDVTVNKNGRVGVFGNVKDDGNGGAFLKLNNGAQVYVDGNVNYTGGGNDIINSNPASPYGLYVNGTTTNSGGGSSTTSNKANKAVMTATNAPFANWVATQQTMMPVTLMFFKANGTTLEWATASEKNFDYFVVEFSKDGIEFNEVAKVQGNGNTDVRHDYSYEITNPVVGKSYFRLKSVDFDGNTETFNVVSVVNESQKSVKLFPNPVVDGNLNVEFNFDLTEEANVSVMNLSGTEVAGFKVNSMENLLTLSLDAGTYIVKVSSPEINTTTRMIIK